MQRTLFPQLRTIALVAVSAAAVACADMSGPSGPAALNLAGNGDSSSTGACDITLSGTISRFAGTTDTSSDTLGRLVPVPGARIEFFRIGPLPPDTIPHDSVPRDSVPRDSVPRDSVPRDSTHRDTMLFARASLAAHGVSGAAADTSHGRQPTQPDGRATSRGDGTYSVGGLCPGVYQVVVHEPGTNRTIATWIIVRGTIPYLNVAVPPRR